MGGNAAHSNEAPPRMRWRGLATAIQQGYRLLGHRGAVRPVHRGREISPEIQFPGSPRARPDDPVSRACRSAGLQLISILGGAEFLPLTPERRKDFLPGIYGFYCYEQLFHIAGLVIPRRGRLSTGSSTAWSTAGGHPAAVAGQPARWGSAGPAGPGSGHSPEAGAGELPGTVPLRIPELSGAARRRSRLPSTARLSAPAGGSVTRAGSW